MDFESLGNDGLTISPEHAHTQTHNDKKGEKSTRNVDVANFGDSIVPIAFG